MKIGRNDPCPCGSGKKYKKCCLEKDQLEASRAAFFQQAMSAFGPPVQEEPREAPEEVPPEVAAARQRLDELDETDFEEGAALFLRTLDEPGMMDGEMAFSMLDVLFHRADTRERRERFSGLIEELKTRASEAYGEEAHFLLNWQVAAALAAGSVEEARRLMLEFVPIGAEHIDEFNDAIDQLIFHGCEEILREVMPAAWPSISSATGIMPWAIQQFGERIVWLTLGEYLREHPEATDLPDEWMERLCQYGSIDRMRIGQYIHYFNGGARRTWKADEVNFERVAQPVGGAREPERDDFGDKPEEDPEDLRRRRNLYHLSVALLGYLVREKGVPYLHAEMGRDQLVAYLLRRAKGDLGPRLSMLEKAMPDHLRRKVHPTPPPEHMLCPDATTLDHFLGELMGGSSMRRWEPTALLLVIPPWLDFVESKGLITAELRMRTLDALSSLVAQVRGIWAKRPEYPILAQSMEGWPEVGPALSRRCGE